jgi:maleate isomerase
VTQPRLVVGVLTPHMAAGPEVELPAMTRGLLETVVSRTQSLEGDAPPHQVPPDHADLRASTQASAIDRAAVTFGDRTLAAVAHASTTTGYVVGPRDEADLVERLTQRFEVPAVVSTTAAAAALRTHGVERVQLLHPPWFEEEFDGLGAAYFRSHGFEPIVTRATSLPDDPALVEPHRAAELLLAHVEDRAEAVFLAGNGFRAAGAVEELEQRSGRLVVAANQALLWGILAATGASWDLTGYGRLLRTGTTG